MCSLTTAEHLLLRIVFRFVVIDGEIVPAFLDEGDFLIIGNGRGTNEKQSITIVERVDSHPWHLKDRSQSIKVGVNLLWCDTTIEAQIHPPQVFTGPRKG
jgi:hypothetical protein